MKKYIALIIACLMCSINAIAQESKFVGTWTGTYRNFFTDYQDRKIMMRINKIDNDYQVRIKSYGIKDTLDCQYFPDCYDVENDGAVLKWYHKISSEIREDNDYYKNYGAVYSDGKCYAKVKYSSGALYFTHGYRLSWNLYDKEGKRVHTHDGVNDNPQFITEAVLYRVDDKW